MNNQAQRILENVRQIFAATLGWIAWLLILVWIGAITKTAETTRHFFIRSLFQREVNLKGCGIIWRMILKPNTLRVRTLQDLRDFTAGMDPFDLELVSRCDTYRFIEATCKQFGGDHIPVDFYRDLNGFTAGVLAEHFNFTVRAGSRGRRSTPRPSHPPVSSAEPDVAVREVALVTGHRLDE